MTTTATGGPSTAAVTAPLTCPGDSAGASAARRLRATCVCGGEIVALSVRDDGVHEAVALHQASLLHLVWRARR